MPKTTAQQQRACAVEPVLWGFQCSTTRPYPAMLSSGVGGSLPALPSLGHESPSPCWGWHCLGQGFGAGGL